MPTLLRLTLLSLVALALTACQSAIDDAVTEPVTREATFGQPDGTDHPWVVSLLYLRPAGYFSCTGTLLTPYVVLTAAHCAESGGQPNVGTWVRNDPVIDLAAELPAYPTVGEWLDDLWVAGEAIAHDDYDDFSAFPNTFDVAVVLLEEPINTVTYGELPELGLLDRLASGRSHRDRRFTIVGYGLQGLIPAFAQNDWERYVAETTLINVNNAFTGDDHNAVFTNNPGRGNGSGGSCFGDSGGPLFWRDTTTIGAIVSFGFTPCIGTDYQFRMDTPTARDFVRGFLSWTPGD